MTSWANQFDDLKNQFVARSKERLVAIESLLQRLQASPSDISLLRQTMQHFHWLAGSGGTYGFDDITSWGTYGEELCDYLLKLQGPVSSADHEKLSTALRTVEQLFAAQTPAKAVEESPPVQTKMRNTMELLVPPGGALMNAVQEAATTTTVNKASGNNPIGNQSTGYTPPPILGQSSQGSGGYQSAGASRQAGGLGTGSSLFSTAPLSSASTGNPPGAGAAGNTGTTSSSQSASGSYISQADSNPRGSSLASSSGSNPAYNTGTNPGYNSGTNPAYNTGTNPGYNSGTNPAYNTGTNPGYNSGANPAYNTGSASGANLPASPSTASQDIGSNQRPPSQAFPAQAADASRVLGAGAPPLSSRGFIEDTARPQMKPGPAPEMEVRRTSRLAHIPTDKKFAVFVDSNLNNLAPVKAALQERGILVEGVATASEAKGLFAERLPDVFIVGAPLIDNNGYELVEYLRGLDAGHKPIVIVLAQQAVFLDKVYAIRSGADAFFEYPSELTDLLDKINTLLERDKNELYKVLSVEDDPDMASFIKLTLQSAGYTVLHIADPKAFEEQFLSFEPDLVMLDVLLGDMTGFEIAKYIRQNDRFAPLPIVFLTTQNKLHQHIRSAIAGGDEHLIKPVAPQLLIATVASRLERARLLKRLIDRDGLTRCLNFGSFMERAQKLASPEGYRSAPAMMMIDVDNMRKINEKMGFAAGDRIISNIANMLLKGFRNTDLIARFGNDQFAIVLEHLNAQQLQSLSSQVLGAISGTPQLVKGRSVSVTCSGGVAILEQGMAVQEWLDAAQDSLRKAKDAGGNRAIVRPISRP